MTFSCYHSPFFSLYIVGIDFIEIKYSLNDILPISEKSMDNGKNLLKY
jgi:hypothetical protein